MQLERLIAQGWLWPSLLAIVTMVGCDGKPGRRSDSRPEEVDVTVRRMSRLLTRVAVDSLRPADAPLFGEARRGLPASNVRRPNDDLEFMDCWGNELQIFAIEKPSCFVIVSNGIDGTRGTLDDIALTRDPSAR